MTLTRKKKEEVLDDIKSKINESKFMVFVNFHGLGVAGLSELRKMIREAGSVYKVIKKTLLKKSLNEASIEGEMPSLDGEVAVMLAPSEESGLASAKIIQQFARKNKGLLNFLGGIFENKYTDVSGTVALASIPSKEVLRGQFVNIINSPIQGLAIVLSEQAKKLEARG